ncbi:MAG: alpha-ketoglutarate-dependent dioxygenase AlkB [Bdellovibrionales bacterium]|nr:alpha-ketoglutarate-dependent dioxygenase AlkB [Massilia sp.]
MDLFASDPGLAPIVIEDGELAFQHQLALGIGNDAALARLIAETAWRAETIVVWGKRHPQPRLTAWQGEKAYTYSGLTLAPLPFSPLVLEIKHAVERASGRRFNSVLLNFYRNERDSMGMHSDDEAELGPAPVIASVSFGAARTFILKHKRSQRAVKLDLSSGSLLLMSGQTQHHWRHGINKQSQPCGPRVNLTFRFVC